MRAIWRAPVGLDGDGGGGGAIGTRSYEALSLINIYI